MAYPHLQPPRSSNHSLDYLLPTHPGYPNPTYSPSILTIPIHFLATLLPILILDIPIIPWFPCPNPFWTTTHYHYLLHLYIVIFQTILNHVPILGITIRPWTPTSTSPTLFTSWIFQSFPELPNPYLPGSCDLPTDYLFISFYTHPSFSYPNPSLDYYLHFHLCPTTPINILVLDLPLYQNPVPILSGFQHQSYLTGSLPHQNSVKSFLDPNLNLTSPIPHGSNPSTPILIPRPSLPSQTYPTSTQSEKVPYHLST